MRVGNSELLVLILLSNIPETRAVQEPSDFLEVLK